MESAGSSGLNRKEERAMTRIRNGHTVLNSSLYIIQKHNDGKCEVCGVEETVEQREKLKKIV